MIIFSNPIFKPNGIQNTIRMGEKWIHTSNIGDKIAGECLNGFNVGEFEILGHIKMPLNQIPNNILQLNHDPDCHTTEGITHTLKTCYPEMSDNDDVTILWFKKVK